MSSEAFAETIAAAGVCDGPDAGLNGLLSSIELVDHHVHGIVQGSVDERALKDMLIESDRRSAADAAGYDSQIWFAVRRWCAPLLGLAPSPPIEDYLSARLAMTNEAIADQLLPAAGFGHLLVETGFRGDLVSSPGELGRRAGAPASRIVRLEALAEGLIARIADPADYPAEFRRALAAELEGIDPAVGTKTIVAYRGGFDRDFSPPDDREVVEAARAWSAHVQSGPRPHLVDDRLLRFGIWSGVRTGRPLQVHTGFGDPDLDLRLADPLLLTEFIRQTEGQAPILLLHTYPFQRNAGYLAQMFPHVFLDVGLAINYAGAAAAAVMADALELAPVSYTH
jgi:hypothetical protein